MIVNGEEVPVIHEIDYTKEIRYEYMKGRDAIAAIRSCPVGYLPIGCLERHGDHYLCPIWTWEVCVWVKGHGSDNEGMPFLYRSQPMKKNRWISTNIATYWHSVANLVGLLGRPAVYTHAV